MSTIFKFDKNKVKKFKVLSNEVNDTISNEIDQQFSVNPGTDPSVNNETLDLIKDTFRKNIEVDAARVVLDDWGGIQDVIKSNPALNQYYSQINLLTSEMDSLDIEAGKFKFTHPGLVNHGFDTETATISDIKSKKLQYTNSSNDARNRAQKKFNHIITSLVNDGNKTLAMNMLTMYDDFRTYEHEQQLGEWEDKWYNPFTWDMWDPRTWDMDLTGIGINAIGMNLGQGQLATPVSFDVQGPSYNRRTGGWEYNGTFAKAGAFNQPDKSFKSELFHNQFMSNFDETLLPVYIDFASDYNDLEMGTEQFNDLNTILDERPVVGSDYINPIGPGAPLGFGGYAHLGKSQSEKYKAIIDKKASMAEKISEIKSEANSYINNALDVDIDKNQLSLGLLYTFEELLEQMDDAYAKTRQYYIDLGMDPKIVDLWYQNIKSGKIAENK
tara:strand:- start:14106 stop:15428 length:1323 start_codon:yes stop_codon:yes gene_type:complete